MLKTNAWAFSVPLELTEDNFPPAIILPEETEEEEEEEEVQKLPNEKNRPSKTTTNDATTGHRQSTRGHST